MEPRMNWNFEVCLDHDISHVMLRHAFFVREGNTASDYVHDVFADDFADQNPRPTVLAGKSNLRLMNWWKVDHCHSFRHPQTPLNLLKQTIADRLYWLPTSGADPNPAIDFIFLTSELSRCQQVAETCPCVIPVRCQQVVETCPGVIPVGQCL
ncbi:hypothetical protein V9T40_004880 [Parthenolecanium corni]|uniref:Uncharacterized protein n=1 Tax=Parthenolecanium corni TaxID=536013 RepID=A0AAN9TR32_9HEMI